MAEVTCTRCGQRVSYEAGLAQRAATITCPGCGVDFGVGAHGEPGAETILIPESQLANGAVPATATMLLQADTAAAPAVTIKVKGFLTQEGLPPGDADFRLRSGITVVGRNQGAIRLGDAAVSARHFQIEERGTEFFLRDLNSSNGTFLNGHRVRSAKLESGDRIGAGGTTFTFSVRQIIPM
jgi:pSer/pThr/pTyr-binding forkhead associated (FHA) protein